MQDETPTYALRFDRDDSYTGNSARWLCTVIELTPDRDDGWQNTRTRAYASLEVGGYGYQWANDRPRTVTRFEVRYRPYAVDLADAEAMVKTLRKLDKGCETRRETYGRPQTFGAYCEQVCLILKIGIIATYTRAAGLTIMPVGVGVALIDRTIDAWCQEVAA